MVTLAATPPDPALQKAVPSNNTAKHFEIEVFTLFGIGILIIALRTYARILSVGIRKLQVDDYLVWFAAVRLLHSNTRVPCC